MKKIKITSELQLKRMFTKHDEIVRKINYLMRESASIQIAIALYSKKKKSEKISSEDC